MYCTKMSLKMKINYHKLYFSKQQQKSFLDKFCLQILRI